MSKRRSSARRRNFLLLMIVFAAACGAVWFTLIDGPRAALKKQQQARSETQTALDRSRKQVNDAARAKDALEANQRRLDELEAKMPVGDPYRWLVKAFGEFPAASRVTIVNIDAPHVSESTIYPKVPYKAATFSLAGTGFYHDFGAFLAELENEFPHMRVRRLELSPAYPGTADSAEAEKLDFQIELLVLFKPADAAGPTQLSQAPSPTDQN
jgi:Tfp pilus assembly protein PilO